MKTNTIAIKISEIKEVHTVYNANELLGDGWVYLGMKTLRSINEHGFEDQVTYIIGKPCED
jgi:hypothetical protein